jgi:predicted site-specific integrase-resolvase
MTEQTMDDLITVGEAADLAGVDPKTVRRWYREERITKYVTATKRVKVSRTEIVKLVTPTAAAPAVTGV